MRIDEWSSPITYFVGRNGSGKSRTARILAKKMNGRFLATDRLTGIMSFTVRNWGTTPQDMKGISLDDESRERSRRESDAYGSVVEELFALREQPEVLLRVGAFLRRALNRSIDMRETSGFMDPYIEMGDTEYSLLREEGHGLRELVSLLAAVYRKDWELLFVDEPELHLHPSMLRLWLGELQKECRNSGRKAIIVTHEPSAITPRSINDLNSIWLFQPGKKPQCLGDRIESDQEGAVNSSLKRNPQLVSQFVFAPRPVLVEGILDVAALSVALDSHLPEVVAQTELIDCGGSGGVATWFSIGKRLGLDFKAVADLDACLESQVQRVMDSIPAVAARYRTDLSTEPALTHRIVQPWIALMNSDGVEPNKRDRAQWIASSIPEGSGHESRKQKLLDIWRDAGLWLHSEGNLEDVLGVTEKHVETVQAKASESGALDDVAEWAAFTLDPSGEIGVLLRATVERIAHTVQVAEGLSGGGSTSRRTTRLSASDSQLVDVERLENGTYRITVKAPEEFSGHWLEFDRNTPPSAMILKAPTAPPLSA